MMLLIVNVTTKETTTLWPPHDDICNNGSSDAARRELGFTSQHICHITKQRQLCLVDHKLDVRHGVSMHLLRRSIL
jgi:hypothetical protein